MRFKATVGSSKIEPRNASAQVFSVALPLPGSRRQEVGAAAYWMHRGPVADSPDATENFPEKSCMIFFRLPRVPGPTQDHQHQPARGTLSTVRNQYPRTIAQGRPRHINS